jgi:hypothetical protein
LKPPTIDFCAAIRASQIVGRFEKWTSKGESVALFAENDWPYFWTTMAFSLETHGPRRTEYSLFSTRIISSLSSSDNLFDGGRFCA